MTIPTITEYLGVVPDRRDQSAEAFTQAAITWTDYQADTFIPSINTTVEAMNLAVIAVNDDVALSVDAAATASSSANYQGDWFLGAEVLKGQSWSHGGLLWRAKQNSLVEPAEGAFWLLINAAKTISTKTSESAQDFIDSFALKIFQSPTDELTEINTRTLLGGQIYEVRKVSDNSLVDIYTDKEGLNPIAQDGESNVSGSDGVVEFYIADGDYYIEVNSVKGGLLVSRLKPFLTVGDMTSASYLSKYIEGTRIEWQGYYEQSDGGSNWGVLKFGTHTEDGGSVFSIDANTYIEANLKGKKVNVKKFGLYSDATNKNINDFQILKVLDYIKHDGKEILPYIGATETIVAYGSSTILFPQGIFSISPDVLEVESFLGLSFKGLGSRGPNNSIRGATTLRVEGDGEAGIKLSHNGSRGFSMKNMDLTYLGGDFTGDLIDNLGSPGLHIEGCFIGSDGLQSSDRFTTARSIIRATYDEFLTVKNSVMSGAVDLFWSDDLRDVNGNSFGGSSTVFKDVVFYDCTGSMVRHDGNRTRQYLTLECYFNPITVAPSYAVNISNVDGLSIRGMFAPSTTLSPEIAWVNVVNCTGSIRSSLFGDLSTLGIISGNIDFSNNKVFCVNGPVFTGGVITGSGNEYAKGSSGATFSPNQTLVFNVGPDDFRSPVGTSYNIPSDSAFLFGDIKYSQAKDGSTSKFNNLSGRVSISSASPLPVTVGGTSYQVSKTNTGGTFYLTGSSSQNIVLPAPVAGTKFKFIKLSSQDAIIDASLSYIASGVGSVKDFATLPAVNIGGYLEVTANGTAGYIVTGSSGAWVFS